jgi:hypothetical protein
MTVFLSLSRVVRSPVFAVDDGGDLRSDIDPRFVAFNLQSNLVNPIGAGHFWTTVRSACAVVQSARKTIPKRRGDFIIKLLIVLGGNGKLAGEHGAGMGHRIGINRENQKAQGN